MRGVRSGRMNQRNQQVVQHIPCLRRYARALLKDVDQAEDLVQETLARALDKLSFWRRGSDMRAWLFTIMHNLHVNACTRAAKRPDAWSLDDDDIAEPHARSDADRSARLQDIETALMQLPEAQRAVLLLIDLEGLSYAETARVLGVRKGTVMSRLHRAREAMRNAMDTPAIAKVKSIRSVK